MTCSMCDDDKLFSCKCGKSFCVDCGMDQGDVVENSFITCCHCEKELSILDHLKKNIPVGWEEFFKDNMYELEKIAKKIDPKRKITEVYPPVKDIFNAFRYCSPDKIKVVIIGQDCYHGPGQAMGLSFSVRDGVKVPPSLNNIYKEMSTDGFSISNTNSGDLSKWAKEGVFMYNMGLTVEQAKPAAHLAIWSTFSEQVIKYINFNCENLVFLSWGRPAQKCASLITQDHCNIESAHPSPLSAYNGFFGSKPFSRANEYLKSKKRKPVDWNL